jgi:hypothetical protein
VPAVIESHSPSVRMGDGLALGVWLAQLRSADEQEHEAKNGDDGRHRKSG